MHGYVGHRLILTPLTRERLFSTGAFGDADMTRRVLVVTWHVVTAAFGSSAVMMFVWALGGLDGRSGPLVVTVMHASFLLVGLAVVGGRFRGLVKWPVRPIPVGFVTLMTTVAVMGWLGAR